MSLRDKLDADMKQAMRDKNNVARDTLRMVIADLKNEVVAVRTKTGKSDVELTDEDVLRVLQKAVKSRVDSVEQYEKGGRPELAEKEKAEIAVIEGYLPQGLSEEELLAAVKEIAAEVGATSKADLGKIMKALMARYPNRVDGKAAQKAAFTVLS
ncbi:MAG: GatB/YqeY domain-containing protein [Planctomycetota bacterium]